MQSKRQKLVNRFFFFSPLIALIVLLIFRVSSDIFTKTKQKVSQREIINTHLVPGNESENRKLEGRPLILIGDRISFIPFDPDKHNTLAGISSEMSGVKDAFVGAAWLVKDGKPQSAETFGNLFGFDAMRHRAFWGINHAGQPVIGVSSDRVDSVSLGKVLHKLGLIDAVMLDSGASTSLVYRGESLVSYLPRPVPHVVALFPPLEAKESTKK